MTTYTIYRVNKSALTVDPITVTDLKADSIDTFIPVEVMPCGMLVPLNDLVYYAETESEAAKVLVDYIAFEIVKATQEASEHETLFRAAQERASLLCAKMREMAMEGHEVPVKWTGGG